MNFLRRIISYFKLLFCRHNKTFSHLDKAYDVSDKSVRECRNRLSSHDVAENTMAYRHMCNIRKNIGIMKTSAEPDAFISSLETVLLLADRIRNMESVHKTLLNGAENILKLFTDKYETLPFDGDAIVYYGVTFGGGRKEYYYLSDSLTCEVGQYVLVPVGDSMESRVARVESIYHFTPTNVPYPVDKIKTITKILT